MDRTRADATAVSGAAFPAAAGALGAVLLACASASCAASAPPPPARAATPLAVGPGEPPARSCPVGPEPPPRRAPQRITPAERVPEFLLATEACDVIDSRELVGKVPFVVVFFASWCPVCEHRVPQLREALQRRAGQLTALWITLDDARDGWDETHDFLVRHALAPTSAVAGRDFLGFSLGYNPFRSVPVVVIVGRSGRVVGVQIGVRDGDDADLEQALDDAIDQAPERSLFTSFPPL
jgi:thiol-disulfide isomerase/thioredoxin